MEYSVAKSIRGRSLSSMVTQRIRSGEGVGSSIRGAISQKMKAKATGVKEKFDPMNVAKFLTGGSNLAPAILGRLTGRSQRDINYFSGGKKTATQIGKPPSLGKIGDDSVGSLSELFTFMKRSHEQDLKMRETERSFQEEKANEEGRRHSEFIKILQDFANQNGTATIVKEVEKTEGIFDFIKKMISSAIDKAIETVKNIFSWLTDLKNSGLMKLIGSKLLGLLTSPAFLAISSAAGLLYLLYNDKNPEQTTAGILGSVNDAAVAQEIDRQQQENISPEEINEKNKVVNALLKDAPISTKYLGYKKREYLEKIGVPKREVEQLLDNTKPLIVPEKLKEVDPQLYRELKKTATPVSVAQENFRRSEIQQQNMSAPAETATPAMSTATPVPPTPASAGVYDKSNENVNLTMNSTDTAPVLPIVKNSVNNTSTEENVSAPASLRDTTPIISRVMNQSTAYV
jgi:hypothetical protein